MIKTGKCFGCKKGIPFYNNEGKLYHVDLFASPEEGEMYECSNVENLELTESGNNVTKDFNQKLVQQSLWWMDIVQLVNDILDTEEEVGKFFLDGDSPKWELESEELEAEVLKLAEEHNFEITEEQYSDLLKWKK